VMADAVCNPYVKQSIEASKQPICAKGSLAVCGDP
jgi:hypothetical protein